MRTLSLERTNQLSSLSSSPSSSTDRLKIVTCILVIILEISLWPVVFLLDGEEERDDGEAADGEDVAEPDGADAGYAEQAQEHHCDDVVPQK